MIEVAPDNSYFEWLVDRTGDTRLAESPDKSYIQLLEIMHQTPFRVVVANDINRAHDGIDLRRVFTRDSGDVSYVWLAEQTCSMLEMFIALAERMDQMLEDDDTPYSLEWYFWEMVKNCGLYTYHDEALFDPQGEEDVASILERINSSDYTKMGLGSMFPLRAIPLHGARDMRKAELWAQMNAYANENYM